MKILTTTLFACAALAAGAAAQAADAHYERDRSGDWKVFYTPPPAKSAQQVQDELQAAKADGQYSFGQEDYPPASWPPAWRRASRSSMTWTKPAAWA